MSLSRLTKIDGGGISTTSDYRVGVITATKFVGPIEGTITSTDATFTGNVSIAGTLTYEDVTNVDSVGVITARNGIKVSTGTATTALVVDGDARVTGILTVGTSSLKLDGPNNVVNVGTALTLGHSQGVQFHTQNLHAQGFEINQINASGIITATGADINGDLDVDGHTNLDNVSVSGVTTISQNLALNASGTTYPLVVHADADYKGIMVNGSYAPTIGFNILDNATPSWKLGIHGSSHHNFALSTGTGNSNKLIIQGASTGGKGLFYGDWFATNLSMTGNLYQYDDTDTMLSFGYPSVPDTINLKTAGSTRLTVENSGVVITGVTTISASAHISNANGSVFFGAGNATAYGSQGGIGRASNANYHIGSSAVGDLCIAAEGSKRILFGTKTGTGIGGITKRMSIASNGTVTIDGNLDAVGGIDATANSTFAGDIDVDGHTNLDNVSVAGVTTFSKNIILPDSSDATDGRIKFGGSSDLMLYHYGGANYIDIQNTLNIRGPSGGATIKIRPKQSVEGIIVVPDGSVELYEAGVKKLETSSLGIKVGTGVTIETNGQATFSGITTSRGYEVNGYSDGGGTYNYFKAGRLKIYDNGSHIHMNGTYSAHLYDHSGVRRILTNDFLMLNTASSRYYIRTQNSTGVVDLYYGGASNHGIKLSTSEKGIQVGAGVTIETNGNSNFVGVSSIGTGDTGAVYLYNPDADALSGTTNDVYGWKAKTYASGLQVNSTLYLSRSGSNGLSLSYNNATGSYVSALSGFMRVGVYYGGDLVNHANNVYMRDRLENETFARFSKDHTSSVSLYSNNVVKFTTEDSGVNIVGTTTTTQLAVTGVSTFSEDTKFIGALSGRDLQWDKSDNALEFLDYTSAYFGTDNNLQIYHNAGNNNSYISENGVGALLIQASDLYLNNSAGQNYVICATGGRVQLNFAGNNKLETTNTGVTVTGTVAATSYTGDGSNLTGITGTTISGNGDNKLITGTGTANTINAESELTFDGTSLKLTDHKNMYFGTGNDLRIWHDANNSYSQISGGQKNLYIDGLTTYMRSGDGGGSGVENAIVMNNNSSVDVYHSGARKFKSHSNGLSIKNEAGGTSTSLYVIGSEGESAEIQMNADDGDDNADYWRLINFASDNTWRVQNYSSGGWGSSIVAKTNGYVGINESNAQQQLHVHDDNNYKGILVNGNVAPRIAFARTTTTTGEWSVGIDGTNGNQFVINNSNDNSNRKLIISSSGVSVAGTLTTGGACTINGNLTATGFVDSSSDIKLKTNIKTIDNALDKVLQLRGAEYDRIDRDNQHEIGVIAQEVEKVIPELVHGDETKTVSYGNMVAVLIEAIKEQNKVISEMKKEIDELKSS